MGAAVTIPRMTTRALDRTIPWPGRTWHAGRWRTPEEVERVRARKKAYAKSPSARAARAAAFRRRYHDDPEFREKVLARGRLNYASKAAAAPVKVKAPHGKRSRALSIEERARRANARQIARDERRTRSSVRAPAKIRAAWSSSQEGSIIRIKYPTMADLDASARRGEWDGWKS